MGQTNEWLEDKKKRQTDRDGLKENDREADRETDKDTLHRGTEIHDKAR